MDIKKTPLIVIPYMPAIPGLFAKYYNRTSGKYYGSLGASSIVTASTVVANYLYTIPFLCLKTETFDRIGIYIDTLATGNAKLGIYNDDGNCSPGTLLLDAGAIDTGTTGAKEIVINQVLNSGLYWLSILYNATPKVKAPGSVTCLLGLGSDSLASTATGNNSMYYTSCAYGDLPNPHPAPVLGIATTSPAIMLRKA